jgi:hypothetical protein
LKGTRGGSRYVELTTSETEFERLKREERELRDRIVCFDGSDPLATRRGSRSRQVS